MKQNHKVSGNGEFSEKLGIFSKVKIFQNPFCQILEKLSKHYFQKLGGGCHDALLIFGAPKFDTAYLMKLQPSAGPTKYNLCLHLIQGLHGQASVKYVLKCIGY